MRRLYFWASFFALFGLICLGITHLVQDQVLLENSAITGREQGHGHRSPSYSAPAVVYEEKGRIEIVRPARMPEPQPAFILQPLFQPNGDFKPGENANLRFSVRDRSTGLPVPGGVEMSASVKDRDGKQLPLPINEVEDGVFEVPFTPNGPGLFQVALSMNGVPIGSQKLGVVGVTGAPGAATDLADVANVDRRELLRDFRPRAGTRGRTR